MRNKIINKLPVTEGDNQVLEIIISYNQGGYNYFTYQNQPRGYYLHITPISEQSVDGVTMRTFTAFSGIKFLLKETKRFSQKELNEIQPDAETVQKLVNHVLIKNSLTLKQLVNA